VRIRPKFEADPGAITAGQAYPPDFSEYYGDPSSPPESLRGAVLELADGSPGR